MACGYILFFCFLFFVLNLQFLLFFYTHTLDSGISGDESQADGGRQKIPGFVVTWLAKRNLNSTAEESVSTLGNTQPSRRDDTLAENILQTADTFHVYATKMCGVMWRPSSLWTRVSDGVPAFVVVTPINSFWWERMWPALFVASFNFKVFVSVFNETCRCVQVCFCQDITETLAAITLVICNGKSWSLWW